MKDEDDDEEEDTSNLRQVEAKLLEFNWMFIEENAARFIKILSGTDNDAIFATKQIRVVIEFLWEGYFEAIKKQLFYPYVLYFTAYFYYVTYLSKENNNTLDLAFCLEITCLVIIGKLFMHFAILELI